MTILALSCFAQQERLALGVGTNGLGISYEREIQKQLHWGATANFQYIKGNVKNTILDNVVSSDYKTSSMQLEGFVKWYPRIANKKSKDIFNSRLYAKGGLALRLNPTYTANSTFWDKTMIGSFELNKDMKVSPNPFRKEIIISCETVQDVTIEIFDISGKSVWRDHLQLNKSGTTLSLIEIPSGVYWVQMKNEKGKIIGLKKIVQIE